MTETTTYQLSPDEPTSIGVIKCIAEANGVDPCSLDDRLYDHVDPEALDSLFCTDGRGAIDVTVSFRMAGCRVTVDDTGTVSVTYTEGVEAAARSALP